MWKRFMIERDIQNVGAMSKSELGGAAHTSNSALSKLPNVQWQHSYVAADKTFCVYLAESEADIHEHARISGFPATRVTEIPEIIDPTNERDCSQAQANTAA